MSKKNKFRAFGVVVLGFGVVVFWGGCRRSEPEQYGQKISRSAPVALKAVLSNPEEYKGQSIVVEGTISQECPSGCWFNLRQDGGEIYVDINPSGFAIPQKVGKLVVVEGKVEWSVGKSPTMVGEGVEFR